ncbi:capsular biosynthesis protein [Sphingomonas sanxanigenens]
MLGERLRARGCAVHRINLNGGDRYDWPEGAVDYRGRRSRWSLFVNQFMRDHRITDLLLFGDCRPMHVAATGMAKLRGINVHVLEEGYIRPDWMTLEPDGVNGRSTLSRDPRWFLQQAAMLPPVPSLPSITASFKRRAHDSYWYYHHVVTGKLRFPFYRPHRPGSIVAEGLGWLAKFARAKRRARQSKRTQEAVAGKRYFLFPLQLTSDYQIRAHSPFDDMATAVEYVLENFARHAPADTLLLVKEHPLDSSFFNWRRFLARKALALGCEHRVLHIDGGDLGELSHGSSGMVCVNSTSGTLALGAGIPVMVLGEAIYALRGVTHQAGLDRFWIAPQEPDSRVYGAFKQVLHARCLVRGGLASKSAIDILIDSIEERLFGDWQHAVQRSA